MAAEYVTRRLVAQATVGLARKVAAAAGAQVVALVVLLIATGEFDKVQLGQIVGIVLTVIFGWIAGPGGSSGQVEVRVRRSVDG